jgi:hypothetical protein
MPHLGDVDMDGKGLAAGQHEARVGVRVLAQESLELG